ncbi:arylesterase [Sinimarinibacterium thermocellulolyticum]|uniref:Arylesterase n=1 Tax=Sinimarinibacterium thermocellulolyticum TaxID=3170016 RepID=A0ABV2A8G5_9GAMM
MLLRLVVTAALAFAACCARAEAAAGEHVAGRSPTILVLGDSLSAAYGIPAERGWVALLQERLRQRGYPHGVVNASVSGETTAGGLARLPALLDRHRPQMVLIELGGNDGLRGLPLTELEDNLRRAAVLCRDAGATPVLFEMRIPSNYGPTYTQGFQAAFTKVARALDVPLVPFFLADIALDPDAFLDDGIHPSADAQPRMLDAAWPTIEAALPAP